VFNEILICRFNFGVAAAGAAFNDFHLISRKSGRLSTLNEFERSIVRATCAMHYRNI
jgi:hypothetical protein